MNLHQLSAFREVMMSRSVSEAARNLNRTQPAISNQLAALEASLGCKLFVRGGGRLEPVPEAMYLLGKANEILDEVASLERTMGNISERKEGELKIAGMPGISVFLLPELLSRYVDGRDKVEVSIISRSSSQVQQIVAAQQYDFGVMDLNAAGVQKIESIEVDSFSSPCFCALAADDPLAEKDIVSATDLSDRSLATLYSQHVTRQRTVAAFAQVGAQCNIRFTAQFFIQLLAFVEKGLAVAIVDAIVVESYKLYRGGEPKVVFRPFEPAIALEFALIRPVHKPPTFLAEEFTELLIAEFARMGIFPYQE